MTTKDELIARHAKELAALEKQHFIAAALPVAPRWVTSENSSAPWVSYQVETLAQALDIFRGFVIMPMEKYKKTFTRLCPAATMGPKARQECGEPIDGPYACQIDISQLQACHDAPTAELIFFALTDAGPVRVGVKFGSGYIGACPQLAMPVKVSRGGYRNQIESRTYAANPDLYAMSDSQVYWGSGDYGPVKTSGHHSYLFCADQDDNRLGVDCSHALAQLQNLIDIAKV